MSSNPVSIVRGGPLELFAIPTFTRDSFFFNTGPLFFPSSSPILTAALARLSPPPHMFLIRGKYLPRVISHKCDHWSVFALHIYSSKQPIYQLFRLRAMCFCDLPDTAQKELRFFLFLSLSLLFFFFFQVVSSTWNRIKRAVAEIEMFHALVSLAHLCASVHIQFHLYIR